MKSTKEKAAGLLFISGAVQFIICLTVASALYPGYSITNQYISDLGVGASSLLFNSSVFALGLLSAVGVYFFRQIPDFGRISILLFLMALAAMAVGIFTKNYTVAHGVVSSGAFFFGGLSALTCAKLLKKPFAALSIVLGAVTIGALGLFSAGMATSGSLTSDIAYDSVFYLGLGPGGMERLIVYPALTWLVLLSMSLITSKSEK